MIHATARLRLRQGAVAGGCRLARLLCDGARACVLRSIRTPAGRPSPSRPTAVQPAISSNPGVSAASLRRIGSSVRRVTLYSVGRVSIEDDSATARRPEVDAVMHRTASLDQRRKSELFDRRCRAGLDVVVANGLVRVDCWATLDQRFSSGCSSQVLATRSMVLVDLSSDVGRRLPRRGLGPVVHDHVCATRCRAVARATAGAVNRAGDQDRRTREDKASLG